MNRLTLQRLGVIQKRLIRSVVESASVGFHRLDGEGYFRRQTHPHISPVGWHLGHCIYIECLWIRRIVCGDNRLEVNLRDLYTPELSLKEMRGRRLPPCEELVGWASDMMREHRDILSGLSLLEKRNRLVQNDYLIHFLINHHAQHLETLCMARAEWHAFCSKTKFMVETPLHPDFSDISFANVGPGSFQVGGGSGFSYDNELPERHVELSDFSITSNPISNARYLAFILDGGYDKRELWSVSGWDWRMKNGVTHPARWRQDDDGDWFEITFNGADHLSGDAPVCGVTRYEAGAFASWASARLPHEFEWEAAVKSGLLYKTGQVWEWCANTFHSYPGFRAYPYREYSIPWFDQRHFVLKGGCLHSQEEIKRPAFRNYYLADTNYLFSGIRLAC